MKFQDYAFTLRKTTIKKVKPTEKTYNDHLERIFKKNGINVYDHGFENEGGLHCHGCVELKDPFIKNQKKLRIRGWRLHLTPIFDMQGWISYYNKHKQVVDNVFNFQYTNGEYEPTDSELQDLSDYNDSIRDETLVIPSNSMFNQHRKLEGRI